jgi:LAO/AO transport system kinase
MREAEPDRRIGVVAVDPSSPFTGGAVLGDRVRMMRHATDPGVYIRSLASRGHLGGLSLGVKGVLQVLGMVGCEVVLVETVGVGQSEVEVARVADLVAVVLAPGAGDSVQMLKAGLLEVGDLFLVNKGDLTGADALERNLLQSLERAAATGRRPGSAAARRSNPDQGSEPGTPTTTGADETPPLPPGEWPVVARVSAARGTGIDELLETLEALTRTHGSRWRAMRRDRLRGDAEEALLEAARRRVGDALEADPKLVESVMEGRTGVDAAAAELLARIPRDPDGDPA